MAKKKLLFKEGDVVVITGNSNCSCNEIGDIGRVRQDVTTSTFAVPVDVADRNYNGNRTQINEMRKATASEKKKYVAPKIYKVNDKLVGELIQEEKILVVGCQVIPFENILNIADVIKALSKPKRVTKKK